MSDDEEYTEEELADEMELFSLECDLHRKYVLLTHPWWHRRVILIRLSDVLFRFGMFVMDVAARLDPED